MKKNVDAILIVSDSHIKDLKDFCELNEKIASNVPSDWNLNFYSFSSKKMEQLIKKMDKKLDFTKWTKDLIKSAKDSI